MTYPTWIRSHPERKSPILSGLLRKDKSANKHLVLLFKRKEIRKSYVRGTGLEKNEVFGKVCQLRVILDKGEVKVKSGNYVS